MHFLCIADADTVRGFRLAGVPGVAVSTASEAAAALKGARGDAACGIVVITAPVARWIRDEVDALRIGCPRPLVVEIPGPGGGPRDARSLRQLAQEAIGIRIGTEVA